jgi:hypothetical protein
MDPLDVVDGITVDGGAPALRARASSIIAGRDPEHIAHDRHRALDTAISGGTESHVRVSAKIAIDLLKNGRIGVPRNGL